MQRIYDSKEQQLVDFVPLKKGEVSMYVCGPTVQSAPHIGHLRSALAYDIIRRWFTATGHRVTFVRNVTDIDDKILDGAKQAALAGNPEEWWALAYRVERDFTAAYDALGVLPPTYEPRATANITQMIEIIERLVRRGHAYQSPDGSANVYFETHTWPEYGTLTRQKLDQMEAAPDGDPRGKKDPTDFALWKAYRDDEPLSAAWESPWGKGRPGWHIECSAMAKRYLGSNFDIHGGGLDLRFPHHENEMAQSNAAGDAFANHWVHNGLVNTGGQKMSKSLGNSLFAADLLAANRPLALRYFLGQAHYRSVLEYTPESLQEAAAALERIENCISRISDLPEPFNGKARTSDLPQEFTRAMLDDFNVPEALAVVHGHVRQINKAQGTGDETDSKKQVRELLAMLDVLGLDPLQAGESDKSHAGSAKALQSLVDGLIQERIAARADKNFQKSDEIREQLEKAGIILEDHADGTRWSVK